MSKNILDPIQKTVETAFAEKLFTNVEILLASKKKTLFHQAYSSSTEKPQKNSVFDLASLTKPLATSLAVMKLIEEKRLSLKTPVADFFAEYKTKEKNKVTIFHLLTHTSALPAWLNLYSPDGNSKPGLERLLNTQLKKEVGSCVVYSCLDFILLSQIVSKVSGQNFKEFCLKNIYQPIGLQNTHFSPVQDNQGQHNQDQNNQSQNNHPKIIPTTYDKARSQYLKGIVQDENSRFFDGASGNAGLFSTAEDIQKLCQYLLNNKKPDNKKADNKKPANQKETSQKNQSPFLLKPETICQMWQNQTPNKNLSWALGWVYFNGSPDYCPLPPIIDKGTVGHLGFTGTSFFIEPEREAIYIILSNRVHLNYDSNLEQMKNFRLKIHSLLCEIERKSC